MMYIFFCFFSLVRLWIVVFFIPDEEFQIKTLLTITQALLTVSHGSLNWKLRNM